MIWDRRDLVSSGWLARTCMWLRKFSRRSDFIFILISSIQYWWYMSVRFPFTRISSGHYVTASGWSAVREAPVVSLSADRREVVAWWALFRPHASSPCARQRRLADLAPLIQRDCGHDSPDPSVRGRS